MHPKVTSRMRAHLAAILILMVARGVAQKQELPDITKASLEDLLNMEVTSVSKHAQPAFRSSSAIYVITQDDIRHSTATSVPDLLRGVPGLEVAQMNGNQWAITARGFNEEYNTKMLLMVDGRSVYDPYFAGIFWNLQDFVLEDIERIEIIRGPGGALWGANAVNGVINIITKPAEETQGGLVSVTSGNQDRVDESTRYGGRIGDHGSYRIFSRYFQRKPQAAATVPANDGWNGLTGGFRYDVDLTSRDLLSVDGRILRQDADNILVRPILQSPYNVADALDIGFSGGSINSAWKRKLSATSDIQVQVWFDQLTKAVPSLFDERRNSSDIDFQYHFTAGTRNDVVWGTNYRFFSDATTAALNSGVTFLQPRLTQNLYSLFAQDDVALVKNRLALTLGSKFEHNPFTGWEILPNVRVAFTPTHKQTLWAAVSRGARTPPGDDTSMIATATAFPLPNSLTGVISSGINPNLKAEHMLGYELGYRVEVDRTLSLDFAAFANHYSDLVSQEQQAPMVAGPPAYLLIPVTPDNKLYGRSWGGELSSTWKPTERWGLTATYSYLGVDIDSQPSSNDTSFLSAVGNSPRHQASVRSWMKFSQSLEGNISSRFVDRLTALSVPGYVELDSKLTWKLNANWSFSLAGQNLLHPQHQEWSDEPLNLSSTSIKRSIYGKVQWRF